jgi:hypothetical protein
MENYLVNTAQNYTKGGIWKKSVTNPGICSSKGEFRSVPLTPIADSSELPGNGVWLTLLYS